VSDQKHPRRGDVMVIYRPLVIDILGQGRDTVERYCPAIVSKGSRRRLAERVYIGHSNADLAIEDHQVKAWTAAETVDVAALRAWMDSDDGLMTLPTFEAARRCAAVSDRLTVRTQNRPADRPGGSVLFTPHLPSPAPLAGRAADPLPCSTARAP
jgi:hypothetical protein